VGRVAFRRATTVVAQLELDTSPVNVGNTPHPRVADKLAADPVVFWLNVGKLVKLAALNTGADEKEGAAELPVKLPYTLFAAAVD